MERGFIDLNADLGEECGDDAAILEVVTTGNIAAGAHAGSPAVLTATVQDAQARGVTVGAHISYPDRENFGRTSMWASLDARDLIRSLADQITLVAATAEAHGTRLGHVKAHGALYNDANAQDIPAGILLRAVIAGSALLNRDPIPVFGLPGSRLAYLAQRFDVPYLPEGFADRAYQPDGSLVPRSQPGAVHHDTDTVVAQAVQIATTGAVTAITGEVITLDVATVCLHGDTPDAVEHAKAVRNALETAGVSMRSYLEDHRSLPWSFIADARVNGYEEHQMVELSLYL